MAKFSGYSLPSFVQYRHLYIASEGNILLECLISIKNDHSLLVKQKQLQRIGGGGRHTNTYFEDQVQGGCAGQPRLSPAVADQSTQQAVSGSLQPANYSVKVSSFGNRKRIFLILLTGEQPMLVFVGSGLSGNILNLKPLPRRTIWMSKYLHAFFFISVRFTFFVSLRFNLQQGLRGRAR